eukprot:9291178-Pyramimonas_sp.AAC.1
MKPQRSALRCYAMLCHAVLATQMRIFEGLSLQPTLAAPRSREIVVDRVAQLSVAICPPRVGCAAQ